MQTDRVKQGRFSLRNHFQYFWWLYLIIIAGSVFLWDLLYTVTAPRTPEEKRIDLYIQSVYASADTLKPYFESIAAEVAPDVAEVNVTPLTTTDEYGNMQLIVYLYAREGDIYILRKDDFKSSASQGIFMNLDTCIADGKLNAQDLDLTAGYIRLLDDEGNYSDKLGLYGIPVAQIPALSVLEGIDTQDLFLCITVYNGNDENVLSFVNALIHKER